MSGKYVRDMTYEVLTANDMAWVERDPWTGAYQANAYPPTSVFFGHGLPLTRRLLADLDSVGWRVAWTAEEDRICGERKVLVHPGLAGLKMLLAEKELGAVVILYSSGEDPGSRTGEGHMVYFGELRSLVT